MVKKPRRGRPSQGRTEHLEVMLTPEEKRRFAAAAQKNGLSMSDWVRLCLCACSAGSNDPGSRVIRLK